MRGNKLRMVMVAGLMLAATTLVGCVAELGGGGGGKNGFCSVTGAAGEGASCENDGDCNTGLRCYQQSGQRSCVVACADDDDCDGSACNLPQSNSNNGDSNNGDPNNGDSNNGDPNNGDPNNGDPNNGDPNNGDPNNGGDVDCAAACEHLSDCLDQICSQQVVDVAACTDGCAQQPDGFFGITDVSCGELNDVLCQQEPQLSQICECPGAGPNDTNAGDPCDSDADCDGGALQAFCFPATNPEDGSETGFTDGYCTAIGCQGDASCGDGNICVQIDQQGTTACLKGCSAAPCRDGYACQDLTGGQAPGQADACVPACVEDADCGPGGTCNPDGTCS